MVTWKKTADVFDQLTVDRTTEAVSIRAPWMKLVGTDVNVNPASNSSTTEHAKTSTNVYKIRVLIDA
jgi:hypothetical protein